MAADGWDEDDEDEEDELPVLTQADIEAHSARMRSLLDLDHPSSSSVVQEIQNDVRLAVEVSQVALDEKVGHQFVVDGEIVSPLKLPCPRFTDATDSDLGPFKDAFPSFTDDLSRRFPLLSLPRERTISPSFASASTAPKLSPEAKKAAEEAAAGNKAAEDKTDAEQKATEAEAVRSQVEVKAAEEATAAASQKAAEEKAEARRLAAAKKVAYCYAEAATQQAAQKAAGEKADAERKAAEGAAEKMAAEEKADIEREAAVEAAAKKVAEERLKAEPKAEEAASVAAQKSAKEKAEAERMAVEEAALTKKAEKKAEAEGKAAEETAAAKEEAVAPKAAAKNATDETQEVVPEAAAQVEDLSQHLAPKLEAPANRPQVAEASKPPEDEMALVMADIRKWEAWPSEKTNMVAYLPKEIQGKRVMERDADGTWRTTNTSLQGKPGGIAYRFSKHMEDRMPGNGPDWGESVVGVDGGDSWVQVRVPQAVAEKRVVETASTAAEGAAAKQSKALTSSAAKRRGPRMRGSVAQDQNLQKALLPTCPMRSMRGAADGQVRSQLSLVSVARTTPLVARGSVIRMRPSAEQYLSLPKERSRSPRRPAERPASSSWSTAQAAAPSPAEVDELLSSFSWAIDRQGSRVLVVNVNRLPPNVLEAGIGIQAGQIAMHEFSRNYVDRSGQWIDDASSTSSLKINTLCLTYERQGRQVRVGAIGGNKKLRPDALGLALCVAVAASCHQQEASLRTQVRWPHFAALIMHVKHNEGEAQPLRDKEERNSGSRSSRRSHGTLLEAQPLRDNEERNGGSRSSRRSHGFLRGDEDRVANRSRQRRERSRSDSRRARGSETRGRIASRS